MEIPTNCNKFKINTENNIEISQITSENNFFGNKNLEFLLIEHEIVKEKFIS